MGGAEEAGRPMTATAGESVGSGADNEPGGAAAGEGANANATSEGEAAAEAGGCHRARRGEMARVASQQENPASESSGVGDREGAPKASGVV